MTTQITPHSSEPYETIKLGIDAHAKWYHVSRQVDGATLQPVQKMTFDELLLFVPRQQKLAGPVYTCYEAGPFGYHLHRRLEANGVQPGIAATAVANKSGMEDSEVARRG
jgi:hypothetical protein